MAAGKVQYAVIGSRQFVLLRHFYPTQRVVLELGEPLQLAWAFRRDGDDSLREEARAFFERITDDGRLTQLLERHFGHTGEFDYTDTRVFKADIVAVDGDRIYALSRLTGLAVIDASDPDNLTIVGRHRQTGLAFEMYVDDGDVFVMYDRVPSWYYEIQSEQFELVRTSRVVSLDAADPANIQELGTYPMPGSISDSRRIEDVLYVVTYENGTCWQCDKLPRTTVTSLDVANPSAVREVDQLSYVGSLESISRGKRSVAGTGERLYIAGAEYAWGDTGASTIDVIDISDRSGRLQRGASVSVVGAITNRWQMDEYDNTLRVVSQPEPWRPEQPPAVETFDFESSFKLWRLARLPLRLPRPEGLRSVRFDGPRGYAITVEVIWEDPEDEPEEGCDPLFTLDLSDPAHPRQIGELEMPGWVYHMEIRGDRIVALGYDREHPDGPLNVSLFSVEQFDRPVMLERVNFGGSWADLTEDQDRIHKSFRLLDDLELIVVPFATVADAVGNRGGVQLIDFGEDQLRLRGVARSKHPPRRALVHRGRVIAIGDRSAQTFDVDDRDQPEQVGSLPLTTSVFQTSIAGDYLVRLNTDPYAQEADVDLVPLVDAENPEPLGSISLGKALAEFGVIYDAALLANDSAAYLVHTVWGPASNPSEKTLVTALDISDPTRVRHADTIMLAFERSPGDYTNGSFHHTGRAALLTDDKLLFNRLAHEQGVSRGVIEIVDLEDPWRLRYETSWTQPAAHARGGVSGGADGIYSWHMHRPEDGPFEFWLDRLDLGDGGPRGLAPALPVPGLPVAYSKSLDRLVVVTFDASRVASGLELLSLAGDEVASLARVSVEAGEAMRGVFATDEALFVPVSAHGENSGTAERWKVISGLANGTMLVSSQTAAFGNVLEAVAAGTRLLGKKYGGIAVLDASTPQQPMTRVQATYGQFCRQVEVGPDAAYCAFGATGVQRLGF